MQVFEISGYGGTDRLVLKQRPDPVPGPGEVAIAVHAFGLNFADVLMRLGLYVQAPPPPFVPGFEVAGVVAAVGPGVTELVPGQRVLALCGFGGYATQVVVPAMAACPIPDQMDFATAAAIPVTFATAYHSLVVLGGVRPGEQVLIQAAAGGVGLAAVQLAARAGAGVLATCGGPDKVRFLQDFGVRHVIDYRREPVAARVQEIVGAAGLDVILDSVGGRFIRTGLDLLGPNGRFISIGAADLAPPGRRNWPRLLWGLARLPWLHPLTLLGGSKAFIGVQMLVIGRQKPAVLRHALEQSLAGVTAGELQVVLDQTLPVGRIAEGHDRLQGRRTIGKLVAVW